MLDLGEVKNFAEVTVNGKKFPVLWKPPFRVDITEAVKTASVQQQDGRACRPATAVLDLEIRVTNLWPNRLIGDEQPGAERVAWTDSRAYRAEDPLRPAGLLGPVCLLEANR
jgi:hypothetical protein